MIVSKFGKSYDTADGSEQSFEPPRRLGSGEAQGGANASDRRWEDDGGPLEAEHGDAADIGTPQGPPRPGKFPGESPREYLVKPTWSVQSLRDLNEAVRLQQWPENPAHAVRAASETERRRLQAIGVAAERAASATYAQLHLDRNPWEHT